MVGGAIAAHMGCSDWEVFPLTRKDLDLRDRDKTFAAVKDIAPDAVIAAAAVVGGIAANIADPVRFLVENVDMQNNLLTASAAAGVERLVFMSSSCVYPRDCPQPMREESILSGPFEASNESYAVAKVAGMQLARALDEQGILKSQVLIPSNLYGPGDTFDPIRAHVASALVRKFVDAKRVDQREVVVWGTGTARRELTHVADLARATELVLSLDDTPFLLNVGTGVDHRVSEIADLIAGITGYKGSISFDPSRPDGMPRKVLDVSRLAGLGWQAQISIQEGMRELVKSYIRSADFLAPNKLQDGKESL
jgi:GDP-L-fucose synthase